MLSQWGVNEVEINEIKSFVFKHHAEITFYNLPQNNVKFFIIPAHLTMATYYRLFFPELIPQNITKLLYIDTDTVVINDLAELYNIDTKGKPVAASSANGPGDVHTKLGIAHKADYFNAGVLLMNIPEWKKQQITKKAIQYLQDFSENILIADQDALNAVLKNNWLKISNRFNLQYSNVPANLPERQLKAYLKDKLIIHFTTQFKTWHISCTHWLKGLYHFYKKKSPKAAEEKYTDFQFSAIKILRLTKRKLLNFYLSHSDIIQVWRKLSNK